jgi:hypothetical protein
MPAEERGRRQRRRRQQVQACGRQFCKTCNGLSGKKRDLRKVDELDDGVEVLADSGEIKATVPVVCEYSCGVWAMDRRSARTNTEHLWKIHELSTLQQRQ